MQMQGPWHIWAYMDIHINALFILNKLITTHVLPEKIIRSTFNMVLCYCTYVSMWKSISYVISNYTDYTQIFHEGSSSFLQ